jgi:hypothetical protein
VPGRDAIAGVSAGVMGRTTPVEFVGLLQRSSALERAQQFRGSAKLLKEECHLCELYFLNRGARTYTAE